MLRKTKKEIAELLEELPCPETILSVDANGKKDLMTATAMWVSYDPVLVAIYIAPERYTHGLIKEAREFVLHVCSTDQLKLAEGAGTISGKEADKFKKLNVKTQAAKVVKSPIIQGCVAYYECKVINSFEMGNHTCFIGLVVHHGSEKSRMPLTRFRRKSYALGEALGAVNLDYPH